YFAPLGPAGFLAAAGFLAGAFFAGAASTAAASAIFLTAGFLVAPVFAGASLAMATGSAAATGAALTKFGCTMAPSRVRTVALTSSSSQLIASFFSLASISVVRKASRLRA